MANQTELLNVSNEMKLNDKRQIIEGQEHDEELCFSSSDTTDELYSSSAPDTCGDCGIDVKEELKTRQKCCRIKGFKTNGSILKCCCWSFSFALPGTYLFKDVPVGGAP